MTCELFSHEGENAFIRTWKALEKPKKWAHLPNPISHHESFMMSDYLRLAMIMPFILHRFLKVIHIKSDNLALIQQRINVQRNDLVPKYIVKCWVCVAQTMKIAFDRHFTNEKYIELQRCLDAEMNILTQVVHNIYYGSSLICLILIYILYIFRFLKNSSTSRIFILIFIFFYMPVLMPLYLILKWV